MEFVKRRSRQRGAETVEFAITLPVILLLLFGIVETSVGFFDQAILTNASRAAAREAVRAAPPDGNWAAWDPSAQAEAAAREAPQRMFTWGDPQALSVDVSEGAACREVDVGEARPSVTVTLTYPYQFAVLRLLAGLAEINFTGAAST